MEEDPPRFRYGDRVITERGFQAIVLWCDDEWGDDTVMVGMCVTHDPYGNLLRCRVDMMCGAERLTPIPRQIEFVLGYSY